MENFALSLIQLWWQFFQIFVNGDIVYAGIDPEKPYRATLTVHLFQTSNRVLLVSTLG